MTPEVKSALLVEVRRHGEALARIIHRWPQYRVDMAYALLGDAVAVCDSFGIDVEGWLAELRRTEPRPAVLVPPKAVRS